MQLGKPALDMPNLGNLHVCELVAIKAFFARQLEDPVTYKETVTINETE